MPRSGASGRRVGRPGRPPQRGSRSPLDPARLAAYEVLKAVRVDDAYANLVLPHVIARLGLDGRDAAFATELASGTLRMQGLYDAVLAACVDRPLAKVEAKVLDLLRLGTHQLLSMRVPTHAAITTTVDLVKSKVGAGAGGFANAVLRKVAAQPIDAWVAQVAPHDGDDPAGRLAVATSHPRWVVEMLSEALHASPSDEPSAEPTAAGDEVAALLAADNARPRVVLVARPGSVTTADLLAQVPGATPTPYSPYGVVLAGGNPMTVRAVADGTAGVQDEGSQLVALALAEASLDHPDPAGAAGPSGERWLDLCAGPGGKSALLAALAAERGAVLVANERQPHRAGLVRRNLSRPGVGDAPLMAGAVGVVAGDGTRPPFRPGSFDRVLVDAPCTGLGALRRRPEARWRRRPQDVAELVPLQTELLRSALDLVRPGGVVVYATCSPVLAETRDVVAEVLSEDPTVRLEPVGGHAGSVTHAAGPLPGTVQLWPHRHATDAMFIAQLRRA